MLTEHTMADGASLSLLREQPQPPGGGGCRWWKAWPGPGRGYSRQAVKKRCFRCCCMAMAFAGQGVVAETLEHVAIEGLSGGTVHVIVNNQIGYTTLPEDARSTRYSTDVAKMLIVSVFPTGGSGGHDRGPLAADYRYRFGKDVVIDLARCYRRYGHNEGDEPCSPADHVPAHPRAPAVESDIRRPAGGRG